MEEFIPNTATNEEIEEWFQSIPREGIVTRLSKTIWNWGKEDLSRLRLTERGLEQEEIIEILEMDTGWSIPVVHLPMKSKGSDLIPLLDQIISSPHLLSLARLLGWSGLNVLSCALMWNELTLYRYLVKRLGQNDSFALLSEPGWSGLTGLHHAVAGNNSVKEILSSLEENEMHHLLSIQDDAGRSVLSHSIYRGKMVSFQCIVKHYAENKGQKLLELAEMPDKQERTSFHHAAGQDNPDFLIDLLKSTYSPDTRSRLTAALLLGNTSGGEKGMGLSKKKGHSDNKLILDWASNSLINNRYLLFDYPSALIMYSTVDRPGADIEAQSLEKCFSDLGIEVKAKNKFTRIELIKAIKVHQDTEASRNGQIVSLMSHGIEGYIIDDDGEQIPLKEIEDALCADIHYHAPKLLILQCCQDDVQPNIQSRDDHTNQAQGASSSMGASSSTHHQHDANAAGQKYVKVHEHRSYAPSHPDLSALVSTGPGTKSERNQFIPKLVEAINGMGAEDDISEVMYQVKEQFPVNELGQTPFSLNGLRSKFCLKSILPIYLRNMELELTHKRTVETEPPDVEANKKWRI